MDPVLSIVMPVYNEGPAIRGVLERLEANVSTPHETLVVYDFDGDSTVEPAREMAQRVPGLRPLRNDLGPGALNAMKAGIAAGRAPYVLVTMADGCDEVELVDEMVRRARAGAAVVAASRYMRGGHQKGGPPLKSALSRVAGLSLHWLGRLPIHDPTNSFKLYDRTFLDSITIESRGGFELALELTVKAHVARLPMDELPTTWRERVEGESRFLLRKWLPQYLRWYGYGLAAPIYRRAARRRTAGAQAAAR
jgi:glycosyltransferase involved in cell wall biosynthesis